MILRIILFVSFGMLVSTNNGYPIIPAQTYPYQQNGYANPSANQPSDFTPYTQGMMVQNQSPSLDLSPSNIRQILLNRLLSNQPIQTIFDQNTRDYGSNLVGYPHNTAALNPVNNYFEAPTVYEYVNNQPTGAKKDDKAADIKKEEKSKKSKKRKSSRSRRKHDESDKNQNSSNKNKKDNDLEHNDREVSKKSKKRYRKPKTEASSHDNNIKNNENESNKNTRKKKRKNKESDVKNPVDEETKVENPKPRRRHKKKPKSDKDKTEKVTSEQQSTLIPNQIREDLNLAHFNEGIVEENRVPRNPVPEVYDLFKSIPNLPENIANNFNFKGLPQYNNPAMSNFFANYEKICQSMMNNNKGINNEREIKRRKPKRHRNNQIRKIEVKNKNSTATEANVITKTKPKVSPKINVVTTEKTIYIKEKTRTNIDTIPKDEGLKSIDKPYEVKETTIHEFDKEEFRDGNDEIKENKSNINDPVSNYEQVDIEYIDDYYPQFTDSAAYTANKREIYVKNLGDTKYYYAVDKANPDFLKRMRFEGVGLPERVVKDYEKDKKYDNAEKEVKKSAFKPDFKEIEEAIQFRSPPQLESPDFQTRKVEKSEINPEPYYHFDENDDFGHRFVGEKVSIYSEPKIPHNTGTKENSNKILKEKHKDVETVFAKSKVATYGPVYIPEDFISAGSDQSSTDDSYFKDGGTTYIMATSLDYPEAFW